MKQHKLKLSIFVLSVVALLTIAGCSIQPVYFTETVPSTFFETQEHVWQRFYRPFTHWRHYLGNGRWRYELSELGTDEICVPRRGEDYSDADYLNRHIHNFNISTRRADELWDNITMGVAQAWDAWQDIEANVDFDEMGFPEGTKEYMHAQMRALVAFYYLEGLNFFGGMPIYTEVNTPTNSLPLVGRSTDKETFEFVEELLDLAMPYLPVKEGTQELHNGKITKATGAALRARLYFNAESYIKKDMYKEAGDICQDIINGKYGTYILAEEWQEPFGFSNSKSDELIWALPSDNDHLSSYGGITSTTLHYNSKNYLKNGTNMTGNNGFCLVPSLDPQGNLYTISKLGNPFAKFENTDLRKKPYAYLGGGKYEGMFLYGEQINPYDASAVCKGSREYNGEIITLVDQVARFSEVGPDKTYQSNSELPSNMLTGEESSGVRLIKVSPIPTLADNHLRFPYVPVIRFTEIHYMLAECKWRANDIQGAADIINKVRKRNFENGNDPNPVTEENLDQWRFLDEWMIEFIGEERRRTDLIRWDVYTNVDWWAHTATKNPNHKRYPLHLKVMGANPLLEQNPGYETAQ